jgi:hypothetical protein
MGCRSFTDIARDLIVARIECKPFPEVENRAT